MGVLELTVCFATVCSLGKPCLPDIYVFSDWPGVLISLWQANDNTMYTVLKAGARSMG